MKKYVLFLFVCLLCLGSAFAQSNRSSLRIRLSDGDLMKIAVNNRYFSKTGRVLTIGDLHGKRQYLKVYRFRPYADGRGGKAELIFSGTVKLTKGKAYDAVVDVRSRKLRLQELGAEPAPATPLPFDLKRDQPLEPDPAYPQAAESLPAPGRLTALKSAMDAEATDAGKLKEAERLAPQKLSAKDAGMIASWFFFDDTRLAFFELILPRIEDKDNLPSLKEVFTGDASKKAFHRLIERE